MKADGRRQPGEVLNKPTTSGSTLNRSRRLHAYENTTLGWISRAIPGLHGQPSWALADGAMARDVAERDLDAELGRLGCHASDVTIERDETRDHGRISSTAR